MRPLYKYVKTSCQITDLRAGDVFSMDPGDEADREFVEPTALFFCEADPNEADIIASSVRASLLVKKKEASTL